MLLPGFDIAEPKEERLNDGHPDRTEGSASALSGFQCHGIKVETAEHSVRGQKVRRDLVDVRPCTAY